MNTRPRIGIIAGAGRLPALLIAAALEQGRNPFVVALKGHADAPEIETVDHAWVRLGAPGKSLKILKSLIELEELLTFIVLIKIQKKEKLL